MNDESSVSDRIAWHPAFYEAIQLELERYKDILDFEFERQLTEEPLRMDVLIIKNEKNAVIDKNIASIFRRHNIVEYKSPGDYVSVDDFYKVYGYACFYKALEKIDFPDISLTFVESKHPRDLIKHLREVRKYTVTEKWDGIHIVEGDFIPIQIIETKKLPDADNIWLKNLSDDLDVKSMDSVIAESIRQGKAAHIKAYINAVLQANLEILQEVTKMGNAKTLQQVLVESGITIDWEERGKREVARNALREGFSMESVQRITGLEFAAVAKMQENLATSEAR
jgi:hypothetical protein